MSLPNNPLIVDLSHWNAPSDQTQPAIQNWDLAKSKGIVGAFIRLGSIDNITGICYTDYRLDDFVYGAVKANIPIGYYWYTRPKWGGGKQVDYILKILSDLSLPMDLDFILDVEEPGQYPDQARDAVKYMAQQLSLKYPGRVAIYSRQNLWDIYVSPDPYWATLKLFAARWANLISPWSDGYYKFRDWNIWKYWQFSADGNQLGDDYGFPSGDADIDLSYYNGTLEQFKNEYNLFNPLEVLEKRIKDLEINVTQLIAYNISLQSDVDLQENELIGLQGQTNFVENGLLDIRDWAEKLNYKG
jgi:GH25 family lysozyme M1 (1,4-beta-N-acetylmuramidase)